MKCPHCERESDTVERRRQHTMYVDDELNYVTCCLECFKRVQEHWADMWEEYWRNCLG